MIQSVDGPLVVTSSLVRQREMFEGVLGLALAADQDLDPSAVRALYGVRNLSARTVLLQTPGTNVGVRLVEFKPSSRVTVREGARPIDADALKVIDFMVSDFEKAVAALAVRGFRLAAPPARYSTPEDGRFTEGHIEGPDGVVCALLRMHDTPLAKYVTVTDRTFSEILGVSAPVSDREAALGFYRDTLRLDPALSYEIASESFQTLLGSRDKTLLRGANFGVGRRAPMIGVIHYGLPSSAFRSLRPRAVLPNLGLQAIRLTVSSVEEVVGAASAANLEIAAPPAEAVLFPQGRVKAVLIRAPHGVLHHFTETLKA
jgi:catechol 2,3-dioxygenase-like lactoylglutathione lyase family enzyme